ncbi:hypothetical protein P167DRAFT_298060 [Morchella conica CCBAS932]|uniref:Uncharacterized protein n=1 Tax=Morchella conica CCBAS932 TaxID=1392247 RepID=A0A3N4KG50_9PEZI|nr:hypothetical protein P167DRAFT_298060 [Morchella conica CCBAS932]
MTHAHHHVNYREVLVTSLAHSTTSLPTIASDHELNSILLTAACLSYGTRSTYVARHIHDGAEDTYCERPRTFTFCGREGKSNRKELRSQKNQCRIPSTICDHIFFFIAFYFLYRVFLFFTFYVASKPPIVGGQSSI